MKPIVRGLSPRTKSEIEHAFELARKKAQKVGYDAGWERGFRIGALCTFSVCAALGLVVGGIAWAVG